VVHQRRLRQADERPRRRIADQQGDEQRPEPDGEPRQRRRRGECQPAEEDQRGPARRVAGEPDQRVEGAAQEGGKRQDEPDLGIAQVEVVTNQRPRGRSRTADELVEQLDREEDGELRAGARHDCAGSYSFDG
jgi:hypothetical protein